MPIYMRTQKRAYSHLVNTSRHGTHLAVPSSSANSLGHNCTLGPLVLGAIGVVFGDIGTSPLYAMKTVFTLDHNAIAPSPHDVYGIISLVFWSITSIVSLKYVALVMRASNDGEGGILALVHLLRDKLVRGRLTQLVLVLGIIGAGLFYGDSLITPAISVMSAIEGLNEVTPSAQALVVPLSITILVGLFAIQRWGTHIVGRAFGPIMALWFAVLALLAIPHISAHPAILGALSPHHAIFFIFERPFLAFISLGAVVLTITGAEALYADMGHFGARPIRIAWFFYVLPALVINYLGQGALICAQPLSVNDPFFAMAPHWARIPLVVLATLATIIASQAVISGAFTVSRQAVRLGLLPRLTVIHTSREEGGQIYVPAINGILFVGVVALILSFRSSGALADAYGLAVTGTLILTSFLFLILARKIWHAPAWMLIVYTLTIAVAEVCFFAANGMKIATGGWLPILIASIIVFLMLVWRWGHSRVMVQRALIEGELSELLHSVRTQKIRRVPGFAVYPHRGKTTAPLALKETIKFHRVLHQHIIIVSMVNEPVPHVPHCQRITIRPTDPKCAGIIRIDCHVGFNDSQDAPKAVALALTLDKLKGFDGLTEADARYFLPAFDVHLAEGVKHRFIRRLFTWLSRNSADGAIWLHLPADRTFVVGRTLEI